MEENMMEEKILTLHPQGKSGKNISKQKYEMVRETILATLQDKELTQAELFDQLNKSLTGKFV